MKYLLQVYPGGAREAAERLPADEQQAIVEEYRAQLRQLAARSKNGNPEPDGDESAASLSVGFGEPFYADLGSWVTGYYCTIFARRLSATTRWCARWNEHYEVAVRMEALWRTWELARLRDELGIAEWLRCELDHHAPIIHASDGPFAGCVDGEHRSPVSYPTQSTVAENPLALFEGGVA
jgi:hypothetical protein